MGHIKLIAKGTSRNRRLEFPDAGVKIGDPSVSDEVDALSHPPAAGVRIVSSVDVASEELSPSRGSVAVKR